MGNTSKRNQQGGSAYIGMVMLIAAIAFLILSLTVFFKIETVTVTGSSIYTADEIIAAAEIEGGDNLIRTNMGKCGKKIVQQLVYIENAELERAFPSGVNIHITPAVETASAEYDGEFCILSQGGKILRTADEPVHGTVTIYGAQPAVHVDMFEDEENSEASASGESVTSAVETENNGDEEAPEELAPAVIGEKFACAQEHRTEIFYLLLETAASAFNGKANFFDMTDYLNINCLYDNRITIEFGAISEFDYKIRLADNIITTKIGPETEGTLKMLSSGVSFIDKAGLEQNETVYQNNINPVVTEESTSENGETETTAVVNFE